MKNTNVVLCSELIVGSERFSAMSVVLKKVYFVRNLISLCYSASDLSAHLHAKRNSKPLCCLVVDSGYSFTHIIPYIKGSKYRKGIMRIDVGGKLLTNHLKEVISYRFVKARKCLKIEENTFYILS